MAAARRVTATSRGMWRRWLERAHGSSMGVWLVTYRKSSGKPHLPYAAAVEEALCYGWIDSLPRALDSERTMLWFAPRKPGTGWSAHNKRRVAELIAAGRMTGAGFAKVEAAKRDGSWTKLDAIERLEVPPDLTAAFSRTAARNFGAFPRSVRRGILEWIASAKKPETRAKRVTQTATLAARNERANQWGK